MRRGFALWAGQERVGPNADQLTLIYLDRDAACPARKTVPARNIGAILARNDSKAICQNFNHAHSKRFLADKVYFAGIIALAKIVNDLPVTISGIALLWGHRD